MSKKTILESIKEIATQVMNLNTPDTEEVVEAPVAETVEEVDAEGRGGLAAGLGKASVGTGFTSTSIPNL